MSETPELSPNPQAAARPPAMEHNTLTLRAAPPSAPGTAIRSVWASSRLSTAEKLPVPPALIAGIVICPLA